MPMPTVHEQQMSTLSKQLQALSKIISRSATFAQRWMNFMTTRQPDQARAGTETSYLKQKGVELPEGVIVTMKDNNWRISVCVVGLRCVHYDSVGGWGWGS